MNVQGPDGAVIQFPDDTPPAVINKAMADHYAQASAPKPTDPVTGFMANAASGVPFGADMAAGGKTLIDATRDAIAGKAGPSWGDRFSQEMSDQRGRQDSFNAAHPYAAALARGSGMASSVAIPIGDAAAGGTVLGAAARGAVYGGGQGEVSALGGRGTVQQRIAAGPGAVTTGAAIGAPLSAVAPLVGKVLPRTQPQQAWPAFLSALDQMGVEASSLTQSALTEARQLLSKGYRASEVAPHVVAKNLPVPVQMNRGQITLDPGAQLEHTLASRGQRGPQAAAIARGFNADQQGALHQNVAAIRDNIAGGSYTPGAGGQRVSAALNTGYDAAKASVKALYDTARASGAGIDTMAAHSMAVDMNHAVSSFSRAAAPKTYAQIDHLMGSPTEGSPGGPSLIPLSNIEDSRQVLASIARGSDTVDATAASKALKAYDAALESATHNGSIVGDPAGVAAWKGARSANRTMAATYEGGDLVNTLTERDMRSGQRTLAVAPEDAVAAIFGRSGTGFATKPNLTRDLTRLKSVLGPGSPDWDALRAEAFNRIAQTSAGATEGGVQQFSGVNMQKAWLNFVKANPTLAAGLFTPGERGQINNFVNIAARVTSPVKGGGMNSDTGSAMWHLLSHVPVIGHLVKAFNTISEHAGEAAAGNDVLNSTYRAMPAYIPRVAAPTVSRPYLGRAGGMIAAGYASGQTN